MVEPAWGVYLSPMRPLRTGLYFVTLILILMQTKLPLGPSSLNTVQQGLSEPRMYQWFG